MAHTHARLVIIGSGPAGYTAVVEALYLANLAKSVTVIDRRGEFRAERILQERLFKHVKVTVKWHNAVEEICGSATPPSVTHLRLKDLRSGEIIEHATDGLFVAIGHQPATGIFEGQLPMRHGGYITVTPGTTATEIPGVYAAFSEPVHPHVCMYSNAVSSNDNRSACRLDRAA